MTVEYRAMGDDDLAARQELFRLSFPEAVGTPVESTSHYEWKFRQFPSEPAPSWQYVGEEGGCVAAYYAALPYVYRVGDREVTAGMVCDVMTHPLFRGRGLFTAIGRHATGALAGEGVAFVTGYPIRPEVIPGHLKVGWTVVQSLPVWLRPTGTRSLLPPALRRTAPLLDPFVRLAFSWARPARGYECRIVSRRRFLSDIAPTPAYRNLLERWKRSTPNALDKSAAFLAWRTGAPGTEYEFALLYRGDVLVGMSVLRAASLRGIACLAVLDVMVDPAHLKGSTALHHAVARHAMRLGKDGVACMCSRDRARDYRFGRSGFLKTPAVFSLIVKRLTDAVSDAEMYEGRRWHTFWIDSDDL